MREPVRSVDERRRPRAAAHSLPLPRFLIALLSLGLSMASANGRAAGSEPDREPNALANWLPAVGLLLAVDSQAGDANATSSARPPADGDGLVLTPLVGLEAEVLSPPLLGAEGWGTPRLLLRGGVTRSFDSERTLAKEGAPGHIEIPIIDNDRDGNPDQRTPIAAVAGRGTRIRTEVQPWGFMGGLGLAFELPWLADGDRIVRIKPSVEYRMDKLQTTAFLGEAQSVDDSPLCPCRSVDLLIATKQTLHALGPGLEVEMDAARGSLAALTLYGAFRAYRVLDGRSIQTGVDGRFDDGAPVSLESRFRRDPWSFRFAVGVRLRWNPS